MATLVAVFSPATASVLLTITGTTWATVPATLTATRQAPGSAMVLVRGIIGKAVTGGYLVATDHEMPLDSSVTYGVTGYSSAGAVVGTASATVSTAGSTVGLWLKVPGRPDLTVLTGLVSVGDRNSDTVGGAYQVIGGGEVAVVAQWSGAAPWSRDVSVQAHGSAAVARVRAVLDYNRVVLVQCVGSADVDSGWVFISKVSESLMAQVRGGGDGRVWSLPLKSTAAPAGQQGGAVWTWAMLAATYPTWTAAKAAYPSWFAAQQGPA